MFLKREKIPPESDDDDLFRILCVGKVDHLILKLKNIRFRAARFLVLIYYAIKTKRGMGNIILFKNKACRFLIVTTHNGLLFR